MQRIKIDENKGQAYLLEVVAMGAFSAAVNARNLECSCGYMECEVSNIHPRSVCFARRAELRVFLVGAASAALFCARFL